MTPILEFNDVARSYNPGLPVLDGVTFSIAPEEVVALLGRNGAGKTTLIHIAMGLLFPHGGSVRLFGLSPTDHPVAVKRRIGFVAENQVYPPRSRVDEIIAFHRRLFPTWDAVLERQLLDRFGLSGSRARIQELSKGQARQLALICAVAHRPDLLILDEPAGGLDPAARREFLETSIQMLNRAGTAILFSSPVMGDVERLGGRVVLLDRGKVRVDRTVDDLRENHCIAVLPRQGIPSSDPIERLPGCLRVRAVAHEWHAVFNGAPRDVEALLQATFRGVAVQCTTVPLEEFFIELLGNTRTVATA